MQPSKTTWREQLNSLKYRQGCGLFNIVKNDHCFTRKKKEHASSRGGGNNVRVQISAQAKYI